MGCIRERNLSHVHTPHAGDFLQDQKISRFTREFIQVKNHLSAKSKDVTEGLRTPATGRSTCTCTPQTSLTTAELEVVINLTHILPLSGSILKSMVKRLLP